MKVLVDTTVWIKHLRTANLALRRLLEDEDVLIHPLVLGELACGNFRNRAEVIRLLRALPPAPTASHDEVLFFIDQHRLMGKGLGLVDIHLLASAQLCKATIWTTDKALKSQVDRFGLSR